MTRNLLFCPTAPTFPESLPAMLVLSNQCFFHCLAGIDWEVKLPVPSNPDGADFHQRPGEQPRLRSRFNKSVANLLVLRGVDVHKSDLSSFNDPRLHANWVPSSCANVVWCHPRQFNHYEKSATLLSNSQTPVAPLDSVVQ